MNNAVVECSSLIRYTCA